jgi:hypothetical protein
MSEFISLSNKDNSSKKTHSSPKSLVPILKKKHNKSNKRVSFGQVSVRHITPFKNENRTNTITNRELEQAKHEVRMENIINKVSKIQEEKNQQKLQELQEKKKWDEEVEQRKKEYISFLKNNEKQQEKKKWDEEVEQRKKEYISFVKNNGKYNDFFKNNEEQEKKKDIKNNDDTIATPKNSVKHNTKKRFGFFGGNPRIHTRKRGKRRNTHTYKHKYKASSRKNIFSKVSKQPATESSGATTPDSTK